MYASEFECVELVDVWGCEYASDDADDEDDDDRPVRIMGAARSLWDDLCRRVASIRPSLRAGEVYGDGDLCGEEWWLSRHEFLQHLIAYHVRQPRFLQEHGLVLVPVPDSEGRCFALAKPH